MSRRLRSQQPEGPFLVTGSKRMWYQYSGFIQNPGPGNMQRALGCQVGVSHTTINTFGFTFNLGSVLSITFEKSQEWSNSVVHTDQVIIQIPPGYRARIKYEVGQCQIQCKVRKIFDRYRMMYVGGQIGDYFQVNDGEQTEYQTARFNIRIHIGNAIKEVQRVPGFNAENASRDVQRLSQRKVIRCNSQQLAVWESGRCRICGCNRADNWRHDNKYICRKPGCGYKWTIGTGVGRNR